MTIKRFLLTCLSVGASDVGYIVAVRRNLCRCSSFFLSLTKSTALLNHSPSVEGFSAAGKRELSYNTFLLPLGSFNLHKILTPPSFQYMASSSSATSSCSAATSSSSSTSSSTCSSSSSNPSDPSLSAIYHHRADFEVLGKVQGVFFRVHTQTRARQLGLIGWVRNTCQGSVEGQIEGTKDSVDEMLLWLRQVGSPKSRIDKCILKNYTQLKEHQLSREQDFTVRRTSK
eukprot:GHVS01098997.1.p1 GENE.GHVS01098997.1~~GHVS01098997.1.p1  ORF type:complete len:229 (+),score=40.43 GHVS01098997.1:43-729(+)